MTAMADLTEGARVRHLAWGDIGTILIALDVTWVKFDNMSPPTEVCPGGYIEPEDLEIIPGGIDNPGYFGLAGGGS
jgi:hypothetical protein